MSLDISGTTAPRSDQQNYDDYIGGPKTVTVAEVRKGSTEQPVEVHLVEFPGRPYKPSKSMRRVLVAGWGGDAANYPGRRLTLFGDPTVKFGGSEVGGIKIAAMSHLAGELTIQLTVTRGKRAPYTVAPLATAEDAAGWLTGAGSMQELQQAWARVQANGLATDPGLTELKNSRKADLE